MTLQKLSEPRAEVKGCLGSQEDAPGDLARAWWRCRWHLPREVIVGAVEGPVPVLVTAGFDGIPVERPFHKYGIPGLLPGSEIERRQHAVVIARCVLC